MGAHLFRREFSGPSIDQEAANTRRAYEAGLPVPRVDQVVEVDGRRGIIFERIDGRTLFEEMKATLSRRIRSVPGLSQDLREAVLHTLDALPEGQAVCHEDLTAWLGPIAAARLTERIVGEEPSLLAIIRSAAPGRAAT